MTGIGTFICFNTLTNLASCHPYSLPVRELIQHEKDVAYLQKAEATYQHYYRGYFKKLMDSFTPEVFLYGKL